MLVLATLFMTAGGMVAGGAAAEPDADVLDPPFELSSDEPLDFSIPLHAPPVAEPGIGASTFAPKPPKSNWDAKLGVDNLPVLPESGLRPERFLAGRTEAQAAGVAWANITAPGLMFMDKTSLETRLDPQQQNKLGLSMSRTVPIGNALSLTWENGYAVTQSLTEPAAPATATSPSPATGDSQVFDSRQAVRVTILPADTTLSLGATLSSTSEKWMRSMSAQQKLFGGPLSVTGTVHETPTGEFNRSLKAGFKQTW